MSVPQTQFLPSLEAQAGLPGLPVPGNESRVQYNVAIGYLRAFVTVLVVAHHAALSYHPFAPAPIASLIAEPRLWPAFPVVDAQRWSGFSLLVGFNDAFFMSLMFSLSGLFVWKSLERKGSGAFVRVRQLAAICVVENTIVSAIEKGFIVFAGTLALCWIAIAAIRRVPAIARVI